MAFKKNSNLLFSPTATYFTTFDTKVIKFNMIFHISDTTRNKFF